MNKKTAMVVKQKQPVQMLESLILSCLSSSSGKASLSLTRQTHASLLRTGLFSQTHLSTKLLSLYTNHNFLSQAHLVLNSIPSSDLVSYSSLIYAYSKAYRFDDVVRLFSNMMSLGGVLPDTHLLPCVIKACTCLFYLRFGGLVHGIGLVSGLVSDLYVMSSLAHMYAKFDRLEDARKVVDEMPDPDVVLLKSFISFSISSLICLHLKLILFIDLFLTWKE